MRYAVMLLLRRERRSRCKKHESKQQDAKKFALKRIRGKRWYFSLKLSLTPVRTHMDERCAPMLA
jgi:hypothetical protein